MKLQQYMHLSLSSTAPPALIQQKAIFILFSKYLYMSFNPIIFLAFLSFWSCIDSKNNPRCMHIASIPILIKLYVNCFVLHVKILK